MNPSIISAINNNLKQAISLINHIDDKTYTDISVGPYFSSIGSHVRHTLDFFNCIIDGLDTNAINLTARKRDETVANNRGKAIDLIQDIQQTLINFLDINTDYLINVTDNLGQGNVTVSYSLESILAHANSHAVHHFATIGYILDRLGVAHNVVGFGYNPTTPVEHRKGI